MWLSAFTMAKQQMFICVCMQVLVTLLLFQDNEARDKTIFKAAHKVTSIPAAGSSLRFIVIGDWGGLPDFPFRTPIEVAVASQMGDVANQLDAKFILALGDNFYFDGVKDVNDIRFQETYDRVFRQQSLNRPWYLVAGNHDYNGNISAQIAYSQMEKRWNFPNLYYPLNVTTPDGTTIDIFMIDTIQLCGNSDDFSNKHPDGPADKYDAEDQWMWLQERMASSKANYLLVAGHYPVYSIAEHGPTNCLVERLEPMLHKYKATAYLCGHDHNLQHLQVISQGSKVDYFVSGSANFVEPSEAHRDSVPPDSLQFYWADIFVLGGFGIIEVSKANMNFTFIEANGKILYHHMMEPRKP